jgi:iron complex outermembrane receptor protein
MNLRFTLLAGVAAIATATLGGAACAADATASVATTTTSDDANAATVQDILVTARRVEENVQKIPLAVTVVTSKALENRGIRQINDLVTALPGVEIGDASDNPSAPAIQIRGQSEPDDLITDDPAVGIYYDGVYLPRANGLKYLLQDSDEISQVEVLRGPQGTLFGRNTTGGAFNITSTAPSQDFSAYGRGIFGNYGLWDLTAGINAPLGDDAAFRLSYEHTQHGGYGRDSIGTQLESEDADLIHGRLTAHAGENFTIDASVNYQTFTSGEAIIKFLGFNAAALANPATAATAGGVIADVLAESGLAPIPANFPTGIGILQSNAGGSLYRTGGLQDTQPNKGGFFDAAVTMTYRVNDMLTLKSITGVVNTYRTGQLDLDGTPFNLNTTSEFTDSADWSQELQALFKLGPVDGVGGVYFSSENGQDETYTAVFPLLGTSAFIYDGVAVNKSQAVFAQANWHATDRLTFTGGLRYSADSKGLTAYNHSGGSMLVPEVTVPTNPVTGVSTAPGLGCLINVSLQNVSPGLCEAHFINKYNALTWTVSGSYQITDDIQLYLKASRGYRGGGENLRGGALTFTPFGPEYATQFEAGWKSIFWDHRAQINAAAFYTDYSNIQVSSIINVIVAGTPVSGTTVLNAAKANLEGFELEGTVIPVDHLTLGITADWFHGKYSKYNYAGVDETTQPWGTPDYTVDFLGRYEVPTAFGNVSAQADYYIRDRFPLTLGSISNSVGGAAPPCVYDASQVVWSKKTGILSARLTLHVESWKTDFSLWGRNLTNDRYITGELAALDSRVFETGYVSDPLTFGVEVRKAF